MLYIGIDLGGTHIASGIVDGGGHVLAKAETATLAGRPYQEIVRDMASCVLTALERSNHSLDDIASVGIGIPGVADNSTGTVIFCTNLSWLDIPLRAELQKYIAKPVFIDNDATVAGFAESIAGVSRGAHSSVFLTLGTGVGGGIVIDGKPWTGAHGVASELGHITMDIDGVPCTCSKDGCLERYCSATALIRIAGEACREHPDSLMSRKADHDISRLNGKLIIDCAREGDETALEVFHRYTKYLALGINNIISFLDPEVIVLGGGISHAGDFLLQAIREKLPNFLMFKALPYSRIELAVLGNQAGIIGAAMVGKSMQEGGIAYANHAD